MSSPPRILLVDDHLLVLEGLRLELQEEYDIVGMVPTGREAVEACRRLRPDLVALDLSLPDRSGLEVIADLRKEMPEVRIVVVTMHVDRALAEASLQSGAQGFVPKDADVAELRLAIREVLAGNKFVSALVPKYRSRYGADKVAFDLSRLTPRQRQIVRLLGDGKSSARIAAELHLSRHTVIFHRVRIRKALGIKSEWGLTRYALVVRMSEEETRG